MCNHQFLYNNCEFIWIEKDTTGLFYLSLDGCVEFKYMYILDVINGFERIGLYRDDQIGEMISASGIQQMTVLYI